MVKYKEWAQDTDFDLAPSQENLSFQPDLATEKKRTTIGLDHALHLHAVMLLLYRTGLIASHGLLYDECKIRILVHHLADHPHRSIPVD